VCDAADPHAPTCFNGSECYKMGVSAVTGKYDYMCDCTQAGLDVGGDTKYAGKFCQHLQEHSCGGGDDEMFCTNGGQCTSVLDEESGDHKHFACECPEERTGTHCEFLEEEGFSDCRLECNHGTCAKGFKSYDNLIGTGPFPAQLAFDIISSSGEHCVCPYGWTGLKCEIPVKRCGPKKYCYNGSSCHYDGLGQPTCDCNSAHTDDISYAGTSCEQEGTSYCEPGLDQDKKDAFCANHGQCIDDPDARHEGCLCADGWSGDQCDIQGNVEPVCDLDCQNEGSCRFGIKGYKDTYDELNLPVHAIKQQDGMYCSCPSGFTGLKCEADINHCHSVGGSKTEEQFCLNGVPCAPDDPNFDGVNKKFSCQCDKDQDEISQMLAGRFCEYAVTEFCSKDKARHSHSFCTNGGKCKRHNDHYDSEHHGCCCPDGYEGEYCQLPEGTLDESTPVTWSPFNECNHAKASTPQSYVFPVAPNPNGEWQHISINPAFQVPSNGDDNSDSDEDTILESAATPEEEPENKSNTGGIVSGILITLLVGGLAGVAYRKRSMKEDHPQFATDWWREHTSEWWKGETPIESDTNIAPTNIARTWSYPEGHSMSDDTSDKKWEYSNDHGDMHDVVI